MADDASTDGTLDIPKKIAAAHPDGIRGAGLIGLAVRGGVLAGWLGRPRPLAAFAPPERVEPSLPT